MSRGRDPPASSAAKLACSRGGLRDFHTARVTWQSRVDFNGYVNAIASNAATILVGGGSSYGP